MYGMNMYGMGGMGGMGGGQQMQMMSSVCMLLVCGIGIWLLYKYRDKITMFNTGDGSDDEKEVLAVKAAILSMGVVGMPLGKALPIAQSAARSYDAGVVAQPIRQSTDRLLEYVPTLKKVVFLKFYETDAQKKVVEVDTAVHP